MNKLEEILKFKAINGLTFDDLSEGMAVKASALSVAFGRGKVKEEYLDYIIEKFDIQHSEEKNLTLDRITVLGKDVSLDQFELEVLKNWNTLMKREVFSDKIEAIANRKALEILTDKLPDFFKK